MEAIGKGEKELFAWLTDEQQRSWREEGEFAFEVPKQKYGRYWMIRHYSRWFEKNSTEKDNYPYSGYVSCYVRLGSTAVWAPVCVALRVDDNLPAAARALTYYLAITTHEAFPYNHW